MPARPRPKRKPRATASPGVARKPVKKTAPGTDNSSGATPVGFGMDELRRLIRLVQRTGIGELELTSGGRTVRIAAGGTGRATVMTPVAAAPVVAATPAATGVSESKTAAADDKLQAVTSPMVGTFYRAPAPDADPYAEIGTPVEVGQTVCIIEAMKLMNEIESEVKGRVAKILVENAQPVEFGQKLFLIEPA